MLASMAAASAKDFDLLETKWSAAALPTGLAVVAVSDKAASRVAKQAMSAASRVLGPAS